MSVEYRKAPFPWFGGKRHAAPHVWAALGDVAHYVEPFAGSLAVLLERPHPANRTYYSETVNDADGLLVNAWRSIQLHPDATAEAASWPVAEADLHARHVAVLRWKRERDVERLMGDPAFCDPLIAGWWLWGACSWIGSGWASGSGPWWPDDTGRLVKRERGSGGVSRRLPHLTSNGMGVNHAGLREEGLGEPHPVTMPELRRWFGFLCARLRHVRILNGDWARVCTSGATLTLSVRQGKTPCGVFLDPPYADTAGRAAVYAEEDFTVAHDVRAWAIEHGEDPRYRIVLAGYEGEHGDAFARAGWREVEWFAKGFLRGGMGNVAGTDGHQQARERLWLSPRCLAPVELAAPRQTSLFGEAAE